MLEQMDIGGFEQISAFLFEVNKDEARRNHLVENPRVFLHEQGVVIPEETEVLVHANTRETFHLVFPPDPNEMLHDEALTAIAGGKTAGTAGTGGTASTASSITISWGSVGSAGSIGTAGSGG